VLKVKGLDANLKKVGTKVSINYNAISPYKVTTAGCNVGFPIVYSLKEMFIINQWEIK
jgi:hypothetical protein